MAGKIRSIRFSPGPYGQPGGAVEFLGKRNSYIKFSNGNGGKLDTRNSITLLAWINFFGGSGPIFQYNTRNRGVRLWIAKSSTLYARFDDRLGKYKNIKYHLKARLRPRRWYFVGISYNRRSGKAKMFINRRYVTETTLRKLPLATGFPVIVGRYFRGRISCMQVYSKALTGSEIKRSKKLCYKPSMYLIIFSDTEFLLCILSLFYSRSTFSDSCFYQNFLIFQLPPVHFFSCVFYLKTYGLLLWL